MAKIIAPVVTIFNEEEKPDYAGNKKVIDFLIEGGLDGILVLGSAGEFPDLNEQERLDFFRFYAEYVNGRVELLAGTGCIRYADTLALSNAVYELGYTPMVISPYYFEMDQEKLFVYYDRLAKDVKGDLYLYNFPPRTGHSIAPETIRRLIDANPNIIGLKDSVSTPGHTNMVCRAVEGKPFTVYSGFDDQFLSNIANNGGGGCIGALSIIVPEIWSSLVKAANEKDFDRTFALYHLIQKLMPIYDMDTNCSLILKKLLVHRGLEISDRAPYLEEGNALAFAHGFNIRYKQIVPPAGVDVFMAAPKGPGHTVRSTYVSGKGVPCLVAVEQNATGRAYEIALAYIAGIGGARAGIMETTFHDETETDLFGEQTVLCGGVVDLMQCGFETLVEAGYAPENAYFECIHEMKLIIDLINKGGVAAMNYSISDTAEFGEYVSGPRVLPHEETKARMRAVLADIQDGTFAGRWIAENKSRGRTFFNSKRDQLAKHPMEQVGEELRRNMIWGGDKDLDTASN